MLADIKLCLAQLSKIIQWNRFLGNIIPSLDKKAPIDLVVPLAKSVLPKLATKQVSSILDKFQKK